jgi:hypothetical protein
MTSSTRYAPSTTKCSSRWSLAMLRVSDFGCKRTLPTMDEAAHVFYGSSMPILTSLGILQAQFAAFQDTLGALSSDVKDALAQLHALRTAQNRTDRSVAELEGVVGRGRARRGRGRGTGTPLQADPERTLVQSVAAIEALLARDSPSRESHPSCFESTLDLHRSTTIRESGGTGVLAIRLVSDSDIRNAAACSATKKFVRVSSVRVD